MLVRVLVFLVERLSLAGTPANSKSIQASTLPGKRAIPVPEERRAGNGRFIEVTGARETTCKYYCSLPMKIHRGDRCIGVQVSRP